MALQYKHRGNLSGDPKVQRAPGIDRVTLVYDDDAMLCYFYLKKGAVLEMHQHEQSQSGLVVKGRIDFVKGNQEVLHLTQGDAYYFAPNEPHGSKTLEDTELLECFTPSRDDYKD